MGDMAVVIDLAKNEKEVVPNFATFMPTGGNRESDRIVNHLAPATSRAWRCKSKKMGTIHKSQPALAHPGPAGRRQLPRVIETSLPMADHLEFM
jgi:hypothetical protein